MFSLFRYKRPHRNVYMAMKHLRHMVHVNHDVLSNAVLDNSQSLLAEGESLMQLSPDALSADRATSFSVKTAQFCNDYLPWRSRSSLSSTADIILVAFAVAMGIRALFLQPFKIPTGSMQPTLYGIHYQAEMMPDGQRVLPDLGPLGNLFLYNRDPANYTVPADAQKVTDFLVWRPPGLMFWRSEESHFKIHTAQGVFDVALPGDRAKLKQYMNMGGDGFRAHLDLESYGPWKKGDTLAQGYLTGGDHLFVDRVSHHFTGFNRGDLVVFTTEGIYRESNGRKKPIKLDSGYYYIKRLIGMPGDTLRIVNRRVQIKERGSSEFVPIEQLAPVFEKIYSDKGGYHGHMPWQSLADGKEVAVPEDCYFVMGDNSRSSFDSRYWGSVPRKNFVGKVCLVFWPFSRRWGLADRAAPLDVPSAWGYDEAYIYSPEASDRPLQSMSLQ